jgi:hypothetical protein
MIVDSSNVSRVDSSSACSSKTTQEPRRGERDSEPEDHMELAKKPIDDLLSDLDFASMGRKEPGFNYL